MLRVWLTKAFRAFNKQSFHFVGNNISCRVEHAQFRAKLDGLVSKFTPAKDRMFQIDVGKECVNVLSGSQEYKRLFCVTGRKYIVTPILNHHFRDLADKHIVLNN